MLYRFILNKIQTVFKSLCQFAANLLYRKNIIVLIGSTEVFLCALTHNIVLESLRVPLRNRENLDVYLKFFNKFQGFYTFFMLDTSDCKIRHDLIPVLQSIVKINPIENFISEYFPKDDIVAYNIYHITTTPSEVWNALLVSSPYKPPLSLLLEHILASKVTKYGGIYFLTLEFNSIIDKIIRATENNKYANYLQIFVTVLSSSGIKLVVKHNSNIISVKTFDYPSNKSEAYIQGIIEQEVSDCLLSMKSYINNLQLKTCIIFLGIQTIGQLLKQSNFSVDQEYTYLHSVQNDIFSDLLIVKLFNEQKSFSASNYYLTSIAKLNFFNSLIFKQLATITVILLITACFIKFKTVQNHKYLTSLMVKYYHIRQEYDNIKKNYPYIKNVASLADLYSLESLLKEPLSEPFEVLEQFLTTLDPKLYIEEINWQRLQPNNIIQLSNKDIKIELLLQFITKENLTLSESYTVLNNHIKQLSSVFTNMNITYSVFKDEVIELPHKIVIPISVVIRPK